MRNALVVGKLAGLGKAVHSFADLEEESSSIYDDFLKVIGIDSALGQKANRDPSVFLAFHSGVKVEIARIGTHPMHVGLGYGTVDKEFESVEFGSGRGGDTRVVNEVAANGPWHSIGIGFFSMIGANGAEVGGDLSRGKHGWMNEFASAGASDLGASYSAIGESSNLRDVSLNVAFVVVVFNEMAVLERLAASGVNGGVDKMVVVRVVSLFEEGMLAGELVLGSIILGFVSPGVVTGFDDWGFLGSSTKFGWG